MHIEIDQSNKIEQTSKDTVLGFSNGRSFTIIIPSKVKRKLQEEFRKRGERRLFVFRTFSAGVALLLRYGGTQGIERVVIDIEYSGYDRFLKSLFFEMASHEFESSPEVVFRRIGKASSAHIQMWRTMHDQRNAGKIIQYEDIKRLALK